jgi:hypothetical protein
VLKIHPPMQLSRQESQKLLSLLKTSFRQQLDAEHPEPAQLHAHPTDAHFNSLLTNPLLSLPSPRPLHPSVGTQKHGTALTGALEHAELTSNQPLDLFDQCVANGTATLHTAQLCLRAHIKKLDGLPEDGRSKQYQTLRPGARVLKWLQSSGMGDSMDFVHDAAFTKPLMHVVALEGAEQFVWQWHYRTVFAPGQSHELLPKDRSTWARAWGQLLRTMIANQISIGSGLNDALKALVQRAKRLPASVIQAHLEPSMQEVFLEVAVRDSRLMSEVELEHYDGFAQLAHLWSAKRPFISALLSLHRPENADASAALEYARLSTPPKIKAYSAQKRKRVVAMYFTAVQVLLQQKQIADAAWMMVYLQANFPEVYPSDTPHSQTPLIEWLQDNLNRIRLGNAGTESPAIVLH